MSEQVREQEQATGAQAADLARLEAAVQEQGPAVETGAAQVEAQDDARADLAGELSAVGSIIVSLLSVPYPAMSGIWTGEAVQRVAGTAAAVCQKRGWLQDGFMAGYGPEMALLATAGPLLVSSVAVVREANAAKRAKPEPAAIQGPEVQAGTVQAQPVTDQDERRLVVTAGPVIP